MTEFITELNRPPNRNYATLSLFALGTFLAVAVATYGIAFPLLLPNMPDEFHQRLLGRESDYLGDRLRTVLSLEHDVSMRFFVSDEVAVESDEAEVDPMERVKKLRQDNPIIKALFDEFGGELVW